MKKSFLGYNVEETDKTISELNEHNELLNKRLERQEEEIKELRAHYAGFSTVETKLNTAVDAISDSIETLDDSISAVESLSGVQEICSSVASLSAELAASALDFQTFIKNSQTALEQAKASAEDSCEKSRMAQEKILTVAGTNEVVCQLMETSSLRGRMRRAKSLLPYVRSAQSDSLEAAQFNAPSSAENVSERLSALSFNEVEGAISKTSESALKLQASSESADAQLKELALSVEGIREEIDDLQHSLSSLITIAAYVGKLGNAGLATLERGKVTNFLEQMHDGEDEEVHVDVTEPDDLIDNTRPVVIPESESAKVDEPAQEEVSQSEENITAGENVTTEQSSDQ